VYFYAVLYEVTRNRKAGYVRIWAGHRLGNSEQILRAGDFSSNSEAGTPHSVPTSPYYKLKNGGFEYMNVRNEIKAQIVRAGFTMQDVVDRLSDEYGWSDSVSNLSAKLQRESIRYKEVVELADVLGYDIVWQKRRER